MHTHNRKSIEHCRRRLHHHNSRRVTEQVSHSVSMMPYNSVSTFSILLMFFVVFWSATMLSLSLFSPLNLVHASRHTFWINYEYAFWFVFSVSRSDEIDFISRYKYDSCKCSPTPDNHEWNEKFDEGIYTIFSMTQIELDVNHNFDLLWTIFPTWHFIDLLPLMRMHRISLNELILLWQMCCLYVYIVNVLCTALNTL